MNRRLAAVILPGLLSFPLTSVADSGPGCGLGQQIWAGKSGLAAHVMAATTNGTSSNQLFGLSFDSLGCDGESMITAQYLRKLYVTNNLDNIARDAAKGGGNHLQSLAELMEIAEQDKPAFFSMTRSSYEALFSDSSVATPGQWLTVLDRALQTEPNLAKYASN